MSAADPAQGGRSDPSDASGDGRVAAGPRSSGSATLEEVGLATGRGIVAAMAMSGMRMLTADLGLIQQTPPEAVMNQRAAGLMRRVPRRRRRAATIAAHWAYGGIGGAGFGVLPAGFRRQPGAGLAYGLATWLGFELVLAPALGLVQARRPRPRERLAFAADHLLYGLVLSEFRLRPQES